MGVGYNLSGSRWVDSNTRKYYPYHVITNLESSLFS